MYILSSSLVSPRNATPMHLRTRPAPISGKKDKTWLNTNFVLRPFQLPNRTGSFRTSCSRSLFPPIQPQRRFHPAAIRRTSLQHQSYLPGFRHASSARLREDTEARSGMSPKKPALDRYLRADSIYPHKGKCGRWRDILYHHSRLYNAVWVVWIVYPDTRIVDGMLFNVGDDSQGVLEL